MGDVSDAIDRDAAIRAIEDAEVYTFSDGFPDARGTRREMIAALRALPAVPPSPAERLARAYIAWRDAQGLTEKLAKDRELWGAESAYRAAPPDSPGAAPPAAEPAVFQKPPGSLDEGAVRGNNPEPAKEPAPPISHKCGRCDGRGQKWSRDVDDVLDCSACGGTGEFPTKEPAKEPAKHEHREDTLTTVGDRYGAPCGKCKRGAVNVSDGKCRACGSQEQKPCPSCRIAAKPEPAPCGTCGYVQGGTVLEHGTDCGYYADPATRWQFSPRGDCGGCYPERKPCPSCRPGGAA